MSKKDKPLSEKYEAERIVIEKLFDVANIAIGALVFGQFLNPEGFHLGVSVLGSIIWLLIYIFGYLRLRKIARG
jgi:hypothetical protein